MYYDMILTDSIFWQKLGKKCLKLGKYHTNRHCYDMVNLLSYFILTYIYHRVNADTVAVKCSGLTGLLLAESESVDDLVLCIFSESD